MKTQYGAIDSWTDKWNATNGLWNYLYYDAGYRGFYVNLYGGIDTNPGGDYNWCRAS